MATKATGSRQSQAQYYDKYFNQLLMGGVPRADASIKAQQLAANAYAQDTTMYDKAYAQKQAKESQSKVLSALKSSQSNTSSASSTPAQSTYAPMAGQGTSNVNGGTYPGTAQGVTAPQQNMSVQTPYGTLTFANGQWNYAQSQDMANQQSQLTNYQNQLMQQLQNPQSSDEYYKAYMAKNQPEAERQIAQSMAGRGLLNSSAYGSALGTATTNLTNNAYLSSEDQRRQNIASLLGQAQYASGQTQNNIGNAYQGVQLGMQGQNQANSQNLGWAQLGQQNAQYIQGQQQQANQFGQTLGQRQRESAQSYGLNQANLLSNIFGSGGLF